MKKRFGISLFFTLIFFCVFNRAAFAATGLQYDRNGSAYVYTIGYMYSGHQGGINTREIFWAPNNDAVYLCPTCGRDTSTGSSGTNLMPQQYLPCYAYDVPASGGTGWIRYALVRHRHNNGVLSNTNVYIPINVSQYSNCFYVYDTTSPSVAAATAPAGWQRGSVVVRFWGGSDTGDALPDWSQTPGNYGSGIHHYEYSIDGGWWTGCPIYDPTVTVSKAGVTTITARAVDGAGNAAAATFHATVYIDTVAPNAPTVSPSSTIWTNSNVTVTAAHNGDTYSGVNRVEAATNQGAWYTYTNAITLSTHGIHTVKARVVDNVGWTSAVSTQYVYIDKKPPVIHSVSQRLTDTGLEMLLDIFATDSDSGVKGYAVRPPGQVPTATDFTTGQLKVSENGSYLAYAIDNAGNISAAFPFEVTELEVIPEDKVEIDTPASYTYRIHTEVYTAFAIENTGKSVRENSDLEFVFQVVGAEGFTHRQSKKVMIPKGQAAMVWFRWNTPSAEQTAIASLTVTGTNAAAIIVAKNNLPVRIQSLSVQEPPDPQATDVRGSWNPPRKADFAHTKTVHWGEWSFEMPYWTWKRQSATITAGANTQPDTRVPTAVYSGETAAIKSGYGVHCTGSATVALSDSSRMPEVTSVQNAVFLFPEFSYKTYARIGAAAQERGSFALPANRFSQYAGQVHFTPVWYPDMPYQPQAVLFDCWTPGGQLSIDTLAPGVSIDGNLFEDWHVTPALKER